MDARSDARWLLVSHPVVGPVLNGGAALLRELVPALSGVSCDYFGDPRQPLRPLTHGDGVLRVPRLPGQRGAAWLERGTIAAALLARERRRQPVHLFLDPSPLTERLAAGLVATPVPLSSSTSLALRASSTARSVLGIASSVLRGRKRAHHRPAPVVQTLTCATGLETYARMLEVLDAVVTLSDDTRSRLLGSGLPSKRVHRIYPGIDSSSTAAIESPAQLQSRRAILYAGELDLGATDRLIELARTLSEPALRGWKLIIACRPEQIIDEGERMRLGRELAGAIGHGRVELRGEVEDLRALMRRCALQLHVADKIHRRPDLPLVLLEGLREGLPLICLDVAPVNEVHIAAAARGREVGARVDLSLGPSGIVRAVHELAEHPERLVAMSHDAVGIARDEFCATRMAREYTELHEACVYNQR